MRLCNGDCIGERWCPVAKDCRTVKPLTRSGGYMTLEVDSHPHMMFSGELMEGAREYGRDSDLCMLDIEWKYPQAADSNYLNRGERHGTT